ncbi:MAG: VWA domain-containing protein [Caldilineaceae bacterium]
MDPLQRSTGMLQQRLIQQFRHNLLRAAPISRRAIIVVTLLALLMSAQFATQQPAFADDDEPETTWLTQLISTIDGFFPTLWACGGAAPAAQSILQFHRNWHCTNPDNSGPNWGNRFFGFHKQFLLGFDRYRAANGFPYVQTWVPAPGAVIPPRHRGRAANTPCVSCVALPSQFRLPAAGGTLDTFPTVGSIGDAIVGWHNLNHGRIGKAGGTDCALPSGAEGDMSCVSQSPRDPIFYRYHHIFDDVQNAWRTHQATDIVIVFDRSGSMSLPAVGGGTRLQAAKDAANMFADLLENGSSHRLGMVSFSTTANNPADMPLTAVASAPAAMSGALAPMIADGSTTIGGGLQVAQATLSAGSNPRKAILLLTDGMENTNPTIAAVQAGLGDTHVCSVGFGTPGTLDGPKLRDLSERQGGIYISGPDGLELRKFFVDCFADIFDSFVGEDPITVLPAGQAQSAPTTHVALGDEKLTFVLSWRDPVPAGALRLEIVSPAGVRVDLSDPAVESEVGDTWHIVRFKLPHGGEGDGEWQARAVRASRIIVNGFTPDAFDDFFAGSDLVRQQLRYLCPDGCSNVLYYEDEMSMGEEATFDEHSSAYAQALFSEVPFGTVTNVTRLRNPQEFAEQLKKGGYDLVVYASKFAEGEQPYDRMLAQVLCSEQGPRAIISDNRRVDGALGILRCAGVQPTDDVNWETLMVKGEFGDTTLKLTKPAHAHGPFSYALKPLNEAGPSQATNEAGSPAIVANVEEGVDQEFFISALTRAPVRVLPFTWISNYYSGESLHPTFHVPEMYWPEDGYDSVKAIVQVTRPLRSLNALASEAGAKETSMIDGDALDARRTGLLTLDPDQTGEIIPTEVLEFELFDDGTNGDGSADDHYWEVALPPEVAEFDGEYRFHAIFELCKGGLCVQREAQQTAVVEGKVSPRDTEVRTERIDPQRARVFFRPVDANGSPLGPGLADTLLVTATCDAQIEHVADADGKGTYEIVVNWPNPDEKPVLTIGQFGRPDDVIKVPLTD